jgi:hypothetical protein
LKHRWPPTLITFAVQISSANCGSAVESVRNDPSNAACLIIRERRRGCGYDNILGIRNCRGRTLNPAAQLFIVTARDVSKPFAAEE